ncbi:MAG: RDD family protein [Aurantibacter sp.]
MNEKPQHAKFWDRVGAYLLDIIIVGSLSFAFNYANIVHFKSFAFYLPIAALGILYKPYMESYYDATLGKMVLNLKVTDLNYNKIGFKRSLLRILILIIPSIVYIPLHYFGFNNPQLANTDGFMEFSQALAAAYPGAQLISSVLSLVVIADIIFLIVESGGERRSLKDLIAKTYVIKTKGSD